MIRETHLSVDDFILPLFAISIHARALSIIG
jgi:hypothetical protein